MSDAPPPAEFDAYAANYDSALNQGLSLTGESKEYYAAGRVRWLRSRLARHDGRSESCLDFGCGTGTSATFLRDGLGVKHYLGFDPSTDSIAQAEQQIPWPDARFTTDETTVASGTFDLAFCNGVYHHIPPTQRLEAARLVWRALKPGGLFAFWENNRWNPAVHFVMSRVPFDADAEMLFPFQARKLLRAAGFRILETDSCFVFPGPLAALRGLEPRLCKLPLGGQYLVLAQKPLA